MYFDQLFAQSWKFEDALTAYRLVYKGDAINMFITTLRTIINDPNRLVSARDRARIFLNRISPGDVAAKRSQTKGKGKKGKGKQSQSQPQPQGEENKPDQAINQTFAETMQVNNINGDNPVININKPVESKRRIFDEDEYSQELKCYKTVRHNSAPSITQFQGFQQLSIDSCNRNGLLLETHPFNILALSSILLLKSESYPSDLLQHFTLKELGLVRFYTLNKVLGCNYEDVAFDEDLKAKIYVIIKAYLKRNGSKIKCTKALASLLDEYPDSANKEIQNNILLSIMSYVNTLPNAKLADKAGEFEVCVANLNPVLQYLCKNENSLLRWPNKITQESRASSENVNKRSRPDAVVLSMEQSQYMYSKRFGEAKVEESKRDIYLLTKDLVRLAVFSKQSIDNDYMHANVNFQAIRGSSCKRRSILHG